MLARSLGTRLGAMQDDPDSLSLSFRPEDPYSHPVVGYRSSTRKLAVRLTRNAAGQLHAVVLGTVDSEFRCGKMSRIEQADYHCHF